MSTNSVIVSRLNSEWRDLAEQQWSGQLEGVELDEGVCFDQLLWLSRIFDHVAYGLLVAAQQGQAQAGRVILQAVLPRLENYCKARKVSIDDLVAMAWVRIMVHPTKRNTSVLVNLALDALKQVTRAQRRMFREVPSPFPPEDPGPGVSIMPLKAKDVVDVASRLHLIPDESVQVMRSVYLDGLSGKDAAIRHGTTPEMVRYRCSRGVKTLRENTQRLLAAA